MLPTPCRLLLVDDNADDREYVRAILSESSYGEWQFVETELGVNGLALLESSTPDCILLDHHLPDMLGVDFLRQLSKTAGLNAPPVVLLTGSEDPRVAAEAVAAGAQDFLPKFGLDARLLARTIGCAITRLQLMREREERRLVLEAANERLRMLEAAVDSAHEAITVVDAGFVAEGPLLRFANPAYSKLTGYKLEEALGKPAAHLPGPQDDRETFEQVRLAIANGQSLAGEAVKTHKNGNSICLEWELAPIRQSNHSARHYVATSRDVTARKRQEAELHSALELQQAILTSADCAIIATDLDGTILHWNEAAEQMLGYSAGEMLRHRTPMLIHDAGEVQSRAEQISRELQRPIDPGFEVFVAKARQGTTETREWTYIRRDGTRLPVTLSVTAMRDTRGYLTGFVGIARDITEVKAAESNLRRANTRLRILAEVASALILHPEPQELLDKAFRCLQSYIGLDVCFCYRARQDEQRLVLQYTSGVSQSEAESMSGIEYGVGLCGIVARDKERRVVEEALLTTDPALAMTRRLGVSAYYCHPLVTSGMFLGTFSVGSRVRSRFDPFEVELFGTVCDQIAAALERAWLFETLQHTNQELKNSYKDLESFTHIVSHDLQAPLRSTRLYAQLLERQIGPTLTPDTREMVAFISDSTGRMMKLTQDLLHFARAGENRIEVTPGRTDLNAVLSLAQQNLAAALRESRASLEAETLPVVLAEGQQLVQLVQNLISNAINYTQPGAPPVIHISAQPADRGYVVISFKDQGIGFDPAQSEAIFKPFHRLGTTEAPGTGIGLATCRRILARMDGKIWAESKGSGAGATFLVRLPLAESDGAGHTR